MGGTGTFGFGGGTDKLWVSFLSCRVAGESGAGSMSQLVLQGVSGSYEGWHMAWRQIKTKESEVHCRNAAVGPSPFFTSFIKPLLLHIPPLFRLFSTERTGHPFLKILLCVCFAPPTPVNT